MTNFFSLSNLELDALIAERIMGWEVKWHPAWMDPCWCDLQLTLRTRPHRQIQLEGSGFLLDAIRSNLTGESR